MIEAGEDVLEAEAEVFRQRRQRFVEPGRVRVGERGGEQRGDRDGCKRTRLAACADRDGFTHVLQPRANAALDCRVGERARHLHALGAHSDRACSSRPLGFCASALAISLPPSAAAPAAW